MIKYRNNEVEVVGYESTSKNVKIKRKHSGCWSWGCCISILTRHLTALDDNSNGGEINSAIRNLQKIGGYNGR